MADEADTPVGLRKKPLTTYAQVQDMA